MLSCIEQVVGQNPTASIIWLHGLGADGSDFVPVIPELKLPADLSVRFIFPNAPLLAVTINNGYVMPAWYDILSADIERVVDEAQLRASAAAIVEFIAREKSRGIASHRILIAGFSQGGAVAYEVALSFPEPLAGLLALSTYFATSQSIVLHDANKNLPIEIHHGVYDAVVQPILGQRSHAQLMQKGYPVCYREYPMDHSVCAQQIAEIGEFIQRIFSAQ